MQVKRLLPIFLLFSLCLSAQKKKYKDYFMEGNYLLLEENYMRALDAFLEAYKIDSSTANLNFKIGFCYLEHPSQKHLAEHYLSKAVVDVTKNYNEEDPFFRPAPYYAYFYYGQALHLDYKFDEAMKMYQQYEQFIDKKKFKEDYELVKHYESIVQHAKDRTATPINVKIQNVGDSVNSPFPDFAPVISVDERMVIFTYRGNRATGASDGLKTADGRFYEDIFVSYKKDDGTWTTAQPLSENINTNGHEGSVGLTPDGQTLIIYRDDNGDGNLYYSQWNGSGWSTPVKYGEQINSKFWEPSACLSPDGSMLFFVSDRPGGFGGRDIYRCRKLPNGNWSLPLNLGEKINTPYDEDAPFVHPNAKDFYFSSQGHATMGGFDIMVAEMNEEGNFSDAAPMPYPINTTDDDVFFVTSADSRRAYYASAHEDREGHGEKDIYMVSLVDSKEQELLALLKGAFITDPGARLPEGLEVIVTDKNSGDLVGIYRPQRSGTFTTILQPGKEYFISYQKDGTEFQSEELEVKRSDSYQEINREISLKPVMVPGTKKPEEEMELNVQVIMQGAKEKPVAGAKIELSEKGGEFTTYTADANGKYSGIKIFTNKNYELKASSGNNASEVQSFSTSGITNKKLDKKIYLTEESSTVAGTETASASFINYFTYNKNKVDGNPEYEKFLDDLVKAVKTNGKAEVTITSSASKVPTTKYGGSNLKLAQVRAENLKKDLREYLTKKGLSVKNVTFKLNSEVGGPEYKGDFLINKKAFEKHQFVEASVK